MVVAAVDTGLHNNKKAAERKINLLKDTYILDTIFSPTASYGSPHGAALLMRK